MAYVTRHQELRVYQLAFETAMRIYEHTKRWPAEERYSLTDQVRRSSRAVCANIAEAWRKRRYPAHFASKLSDADAEAAETQNWLEFANACGHLSQDDLEALSRAYDHISGGLVKMITESEAWCGPANLIRETVSEYLIPPQTDC